MSSQSSHWNRPSYMFVGSFSLNGCTTDPLKSVVVSYGFRWVWRICLGKHWGLFNLKKKKILYLPHLVFKFYDLLPPSLVLLLQMTHKNFFWHLLLPLICFCSQYSEEMASLKAESPRRSLKYSDRADWEGVEKWHLISWNQPHEKIFLSIPCGQALSSSFYLPLVLLAVILTSHRLLHFSFSLQEQVT